MRSVPSYAHRLASTRRLWECIERYNALTSPSALKTDDEHKLDRAMARELARELRPYILLGIVGESESGWLYLDQEGIR